MEPRHHLGHYQILSRLGAGGMGEVYLARDTRLNRRVAIKTLLPSFAADQQRLKRFLHEARVTSSLNHPNIGHLYESAESDGVHYLVLEYVDGPTVGARLASGPLPIPELLDLATQAADALSDAHSSGILHRDLKPENLMIDRRGQLKILDFGLARMDTAEWTQSVPAVTDTTRTAALTNPGAVMGTPLYMSPEQALGRMLDARSDLFSLGVVLYQMATGTLPFRGATSPEITDAILHQTPASPIRLNPAIPAELERMIQRLMEKDPALRYQTAADLRADLKRLKRDSESGPQATPQTPAAKRSWLPIAALATAGLLTGLLFLAQRNRPAQPQPAAELMVRPILNAQTPERAPALSPDGNTVAYAWSGDEGETYDLYVKLIDAGNPLRLTNTPDAFESRPTWSPDGKFIMFSRGSLKSRTTEIVIIPALGGAERVVAQQPGFFGPEGRPTHAWHPGGKKIVCSLGQRANPFELALIDLESGARTPLTKPPAGTIAEMSPQFFADGSKLAFIRHRTTTHGTLEVLTLADKSLRSYPVPLSSVIGLAITPGEQSVLLTTFGALRELRLDSGAVLPASAHFRNAMFPSFSAGGKRMAFEQRLADTNIWRVTLERPDRAGAPTQWIASTSAEEDPRYSRDGSRIAFASDRSGVTMPWIAGRDGRNPQMVPVNGPYYGSLQLSPDGAWIVYDARINGDAQIMLVATTGGKPRQLTSDKTENVVPGWSHDGQWIYYCSNRTGRQEIWRVPFQGGNSEQVTRDGGFDAQESRDGKYLYFSRRREALGLVRRTVDGAEEMLIPDAFGRMWVAGQDGIYYVDRTQSHLLYFNFATRKSSSVMQLPKGTTPLSRGLDLSPDGRELLFRQVDSASSDIALVENYR